jgi:hypothetical protein
MVKNKLFKSSYLFIKFYLTKNNIGLTLNLIGTILIAVAFGILPPDTGMTVGSRINGKIIHNAYMLYPWLFRIGLLFLAIGFILQLQKKNE